MSDKDTLDLDELEAYVLIGRKPGQTEYIVLASSNLTLPEFGAMMGRMQTDWMVRTAAYGVSTLSKASPLVVPGRKMS